MENTVDYEFWYTQIKEALGRLAAPAENQIQYLIQHGFAPCADELALELDDIIPFAQQLLMIHRLPQEGFDRIVNLNQYLGFISGQVHADLWTSDALRDAEEWKTVRLLARSALEQL
jgi:hypothetical protein